jgi:hypothetical protein
MIVVGSAFIILGVLLLAVGTIVSDAVGAATASCGAPPCLPADPGGWFVWTGLGVVVVALPFVVLGFWRALR